MAEQQSTVATPDARAAEMEQTWAIVRALLGGTAAMRKAGALGVSTDGKPSKKQRRQIHQLRGGQD